MPRPKRPPPPRLRADPTGFVSRFPGFVLMMLGVAGMMMLPALHAARLGRWEIAQTFLDHGLFFGIVGVILGLATMNRVPRIAARYHLVTIVLIFALIPAVMAAPLRALIPGMSFGAAYFEMLSSFTTTGATLFDRPALLPEPLHLWRALSGWMGGLLVLGMAFAILAPLNLGGFELQEAPAHHGESRLSATIEEANRRILRFLRTIAPVYVIFTGVLALLLIFAGDRPFIAICHAMATLSTSGISPVGGLQGAQSGWLGEVAIAVFLLAAVSHRVLRFDLRKSRRPSFADPQIQLMLITVLGVTLVLFLRSFVGAVEISRQDNLTASVQAIWGSVFTTLSFLTTMGFESADWRTMQLWSDLPAPGIILMGMAVMGGGIATTAGGIKLLRLYALYRHGLREMDLLIHPSAMGRRGQGERLISDEGARMAFIFLMLFLVALALVMIALAATGIGFVTSVALAVASLTTTGPLINVLGEGARYSDLNAVARYIFCAAMIVGRMEILVIFALFNPAFWRR